MKDETTGDPEHEVKELFEAFHGVPAAPWGSPSFGSPHSIFQEPFIVDFLVPDDGNRLPEFGFLRQHVEAIAGEDLTLEQKLRY